jgi:hypothetical protein
VVQTTYTHESKCKNDNIKERKRRDSGFALFVYLECSKQVPDTLYSVQVYLLEEWECFHLVSCLSFGSLLKSWLFLVVFSGELYPQ